MEFSKDLQGGEGKQRCRAWRAHRQRRLLEKHVLQPSNIQTGGRQVCVYAA